MKKLFKFVAPGLVLGLVACGGGGSGGSGGSGGEANINFQNKSTVATASIMPATTSCPNGGIQINIGIDENGNGLLDTNEIDNVDYVCHGESGLNGKNGFAALIKSITENPGENCTNGGNRIEVGIDINGDGVLVSEEVSQVSYVCNGTDKSSEQIELVGRWAVTSYNNGFAGESGVIVFNEDNTFVFEGGTASVVGGCSRQYCSQNEGIWEAVESDLFSLTLEGSTPTFVAATNISRNQITFMRDSNLSIFKRVVSPQEIPIANAGPDQKIDLGMTANLDGSASADANGDDLSYKWSFISKPWTSTATISGSMSSISRFTPDVSGDYILGLIVSDGHFSSLVDTVAVVVKSPWSSLADDFGLPGGFSAQTVNLLPLSSKGIYSFSSYSPQGVLMANYGNGTLSWVNGTGGAAGFAVDPKNNQHFVKFEGLAVYSSTDAGEVWEKISSSDMVGSGLGQVGWGVRHLKFSPDGEALYLFSDNGTSYGPGIGLSFSVSFDAGKTWNAPTGLPFNSGYGPVAFSSQDPSKVYMFGGSNLYRSSDRGLNWELVASYSSNYQYNEQSIIADPFNSNTIFTLTLNELNQKRMFKSTNGGDVFVELQIDYLTATEFDYLYTDIKISVNEYVDGLMYVCVYSSGSYNGSPQQTPSLKILRSRDGGETWALLNGFGNAGLHEPYPISSIVSGSPGAEGEIDLYIAQNGQIYHYVDKF